MNCLRNKRGVVGIVLFLTVMILISLAMWTENSYSKYFTKDDLLMNYGMSIKEGQGGSGTMLTSGPAISLPKGDYEIVLRYSATGNDNYVMLLDQADDYGWSNISIDGYETPVVFLDPEDNWVKLNVHFLENENGLEVCTVYGGIGDFSISGIEISSVGDVCKDAIMLPVILLVLAIILYIVWHKKDASANKRMLILGGVILLASIPCFMNYLVSGHDMEFEVGRIVGIAEGLKCGQFPVRIHPTTFAGYGYDVSIFYPELLLYFPALLYLMGMSLSLSIHIYLFAVNAASILVMYYVARRLLRCNKSALLAATMYGFAAYRLTYLYLMNGYGSGAAMIFIPLVILGMYEILEGDSKKWIYLVIGVTGVLQTHILSFVIVCIFVAIVFVIHLITRHSFKRYLSLLYAAGISVLLNLWFLVPFFMFYNSGLQTDLLQGDPAWRSLSLVNLLGIWPEFGLGIQTKNAPATGVPAILDLVILIGCVLALISWVGRYNGIKESPIDELASNSANGDLESKEIAGKLPAVMKMLLGIGVFAAFMSTKYFPWELLEQIPGIEKVLHMIQHAQRVLHVAVPCLTLVAAYGYMSLVHKKREAALPKSDVEDRDGNSPIEGTYDYKNEHGFVIVYLIVYVTGILTSAYMLNGYMRQDIRMAKGELLSSYVGTEEYLYEGTTTKGIVPGQIHASSEWITYENYAKDGTTVELSYSAGEEGFLELPLFYYPGYRATINGEVTGIEKGDNNVIRIHVSEGSSGTLRVWYNGFVIWRVAEIISVVALLALIVCGILNKRNRAAEKE